MEVRLLGTGSADGWPNPFCACASCAWARSSGTTRTPTAALVDDRLLLDCGPGIGAAAARAGVALDRVEVVLVTHVHNDHLDPAWLLYRRWVTSAPLTLVGPAPVLEAVRPWLAPCGSEVVLREAVAGVPFEVAGGYVVRPVAADHDAFGACLLYDVTGPDGVRLLYATDTGAALDDRWLAEPHPADGDPSARPPTARRTDPADRADPADLADPADPADPSDRADPADPADRADPGDPADRADRANPADPAEPADPADRAGRADLADEVWQQRDLVLLEETFGTRPADDLTRGHLNLEEFAAVLGRWRAIGVVGESTAVVAVHLSHHNPPEPEFGRRLAALGARAVPDGTRLLVRAQGA